MTYALEAEYIQGLHIDYETLFQASDDALYKAKSYGKDRFVEYKKD